MDRKLDNAAWEEYIDKFNSYEGSITVKDFCIENKLTKTQFYYHKRRLDKTKIENTQPIFHSISLNNKEDSVKENKSKSKEIKINIGNANITIPVSETNLIASIIKELVAKC